MEAGWCRWLQGSPRLYSQGKFHARIPSPHSLGLSQRTSGQTVDFGPYPYQVPVIPAAAMLPGHGMAWTIPSSPILCNLEPGRPRSGTAFPRLVSANQTKSWPAAVSGRSVRCPAAAAGFPSVPVPSVHSPACVCLPCRYREWTCVWVFGCGSKANANAMTGLRRQRLLCLLTGR